MPPEMPPGNIVDERSFRELNWRRITQSRVLLKERRVQGAVVFLSKKIVLWIQPTAVDEYLGKPGRFRCQVSDGKRLSRRRGCINSK